MNANGPIRILLVEDEPAHAEAIRRALASGDNAVDIKVAASLAEFHQVIAKQTPHIALLDMNLPDGRAVDVLRAPAEESSFPILIMTSYGDESVAVEAMKAGALDYIVKSPEAFRDMPRSVDRALREWSLLQQRKLAETRIVHLNSVLNGIRHVNQLITHSSERQPLLQTACARLVESLGYQAVWIVTVDKDGTFRLREHAGLLADLTQRFREQLALGVLPECAQRAYRQHSVIGLDLPCEHCLVCDATQVSTHEGVLAARLEHSGNIYGIMLASVPKAYVRDDEEQRLFAELVADLASALYRIELEKQHKEAEAALAQSETRYRELVENIEDVVFSLSIDGRILYVSPSVQRNYGYRPEELLGGEFAVFVRDDEIPRLQAYLQRTLEGFVEPIEFCGYDKQGRLRQLRSTSRVRIENGAPVAVNGVLLDVTQLHQAVAAVQHSAERWQSTFNAISDIVCVISTDHKFVEINQAGCNVLGLSRHQIVGRSCYELVHQQGQPIPMCPCTAASLSKQPEFARYQQQGKTYDLTAWPLSDGRGVPHGFVHVIKDVTAEVQASAEKQQLEEQLSLSQRLEAVGRLAGGVAHDFNNLLSVILSYSSFALDELRTSDPIHSDILEIQKSGQRAAALTRQLLAFSRRQVLEPEVINLNKIVAGIESMLRRLLGEDIDIVVRLSDELGSVEADIGQIEQVIMNLAVNARDAMPKGGTLAIDTANVEFDEDDAKTHMAVSPGRFVLLSVSDTGVGMDASTREHIFEPFFTTKEKGKGTGLGLATVYGIVKQSGGNIWVYSEKGQGTTFKVYLPRVDAPLTATKRELVSLLANGDETVLVVEDEDAVRRLTERILLKSGYKVLAAANGGEAFLLCEKHHSKIDLLLTDVVMPQMGGRELADRLAKIKPGLRALYMSGYTDSAIEHHGVLEPGMRFIAKPFSAIDLTRKVREALDEHA